MFSLYLEVFVIFIIGKIITTVAAINSTPPPPIGLNYFAKKVVLKLPHQTVSVETVFKTASSVVMG